MKQNAYLLTVLKYSLAACGFALILAGCEYLRLLQFKNQFKQIERYFQIESASSGTTLTCLRPILTPDDAQLIFDDTPTSIRSNETSTRWHYDFQKRYIRGHGETANFDFSQILTFEQGKMTTLQYTAAFLSVFDGGLLQRILHAIGQGTLAENEERLEFQAGLDNTPRPTQQQFKTAWGMPYAILPVESEVRHLYVYTLSAPHIPKGEPVSLLTIWLVFTPESQSLERLTAWYKHHSLELSFTESAMAGYINIDL